MCPSARTITLPARGSGGDLVGICNHFEASSLGQLDKQTILSGRAPKEWSSSQIVLSVQSEVHLVAHGVRWVHELAQNAGRYLKRARRGEAVEVTDHVRSMALFVSIGSDLRSGSWPGRSDQSQS